MPESTTIPHPSLFRLHPEVYLRFGLRVFLAAVLLVASGLKCYELSTTPVLGNSFLESRWVGILAVNVELLVACLLLANVFPKLTWAGTTLLFGLFSVVSAVSWISGSDSCNCFGKVHVNPGLTMALDLIIVALLMKSRPERSLFNWKEVSQELFRVKKQVFVVAFSWLLLAVPATFAMMSIQKNEIAELGTEFIGADGRKTILLEPEKWVGKECPLLPYIEPAELRGKLKAGNWTIVLYHQDCSKCGKVARDFLAKKTKSLAFIEVAPLRQGGEPILNGVNGWLVEQYGWLVETPCVVHL